MGGIDTYPCRTASNTRVCIFPRQYFAFYAIERFKDGTYSNACSVRSSFPEFSLGFQLFKLLPNDWRLGASHKADNNQLAWQVPRSWLWRKKWQMSLRSARISRASAWRRPARSIAVSSARKQAERKQRSRATVGIRPARSEVMRWNQGQMQKIFLLDIRRLPETLQN